MPNTDTHYTRLEAATQKTFNDMIQDFGVVTVMNVDIYSISDIEEMEKEKLPEQEAMEDKNKKESEKQKDGTEQE